MYERPVIIVLARDGIRATVTGDQASRLRAAGHATADYRSDLTARELDAWLTADDQRDVAVCDFCDRAGVAYEFPCADHDVIGGGRSVGAWAACEPCATLITADRRDDLAERCARELDVPVAFAELLEAGFWAHRAGAGRRVTPP